MKNTLATIAALAVLTTSTIASAQSSIYFEDNFDGEDLAPEWEVSNPNPDGYLVEDGVLIMLAQDGTPANYAQAENILRLNKPVPKGDWTMTARFQFTPQSMGEMVRIGVAKDEKNSMLASMNLESYNYALTNVWADAEKLSRGKATSFRRFVYKIESRDLEQRASQFRDNIQGVQLRLEKKGRKYTTALRFESTSPGAEGSVSEEWFTVQQLTSLRAPGDAFTLVFSSNSNTYTPGGGEGLVEVDWVKVEVNE